MNSPLLAQTIGDQAMQPVQFALDADVGFIDLHHRCALLSPLDGGLRVRQRLSRLLVEGLHAGLAQRESKVALHQLTGVLQGYQMVLIQIRPGLWRVGHTGWRRRCPRVSGLHARPRSGSLSASVDAR